LTTDRDRVHVSLVPKTKLVLSGLALLSLSAGPARADDPSPPAAPPPTQPSPSPPAAPEPPLYESFVTATTPLHGSGIPRDHVPANVQTISGADIAEHRSLDLTSHMDEMTGSVHINDVQNNPLQPDLQYRGFLASPLLGAPQGLSVFLDGVRLNEPFGDTINWDLLPTNAIRSVDILPGSNPIFGLNTLGGAVSIETKNGFTDPGAAGTLLAGSWGRKLGLVSAGAHGEKFGVFAAAQFLAEDGWRQRSPTRAGQAFISTSYEGGASPSTAGVASVKAELVLLAASTSLTGNGPSPEQLLAMDRAAVFTAPDRTENRLFMAIARGERPLASHLRLSGTAYLRTSRTSSVNGDQRDWAECTATPGFLCSADEGGTQTPVRDPTGDKADQAVPFDPSYDAAVNSSNTRQTGYGAAAQVAVDLPALHRENHLFVGAELGQGRVRFRSQSTVASLDGGRSTIDTGLVDPASPIAVDSVTNMLGLYASDTFSLLPDLFVSASVRLNATSLSLRDRLGDHLTGDHGFRRLNPAIGLSYQPRPFIGAFAGFSQSNRAPTVIELTCASPADPCRLPNSFVADPPLSQVVAHTFELGVRGRFRQGRLKLDYAAAAFQTTNSNDIVFISSGMVANRGYFSNVGDTRRQGLEAHLGARHRVGERARLEWSLGYTFTDARFLSPFTALSATHPDAMNGRIDVPAGAHIPSIPRSTGKASLTVVSGLGLSGGVSVIADSSQYFRGDEANLLPQIPGHVVVNARLAYQIGPPVSVFVLANNLFDTRYSTFGVLGDATEVLGPTYDSPRFLGPGAPRAAWAGLDLHYY
jgi:outer membrane receptor protein involved in Fe transport